MVLTNSTLFYVVGCYLIDSYSFTISLLGLFTIVNAFIHLVAAFAVSRFNRTSLDIHYLLRSLVLTFITISIPVQFDGVTTTFIWSVMAILLFTYGRSKEHHLFEIYSLFLFGLAGTALFFEWGLFRQRVTDPANYLMFANRTFASAIFYSLCLVAAIFIHNRYSKTSILNEEYKRTVIYFFAAIALLVIYNAVRFEIGNHFYYDLLLFRNSNSLTDVYEFSTLREESNYLSLLWQGIFTLFYFSVVGLVNFYKLKDQILSTFTLVINTLVTVIFIIAGFIILGQLRDSVLLGEASQIRTTLSDLVLIRNISLVTLAVSLSVQFLYSRSADMIQLVQKPLKEIYECYFSIIILIILSSELINWTTIFGIRDSYKYGLSILWGVYALIIVGIGIYQKKKHLRFTAFGILGLTLVKLFLYDTSELGTLEKTAVFIAVGVLMLVVAFLYNKFKDVIISDTRPNNS